MFVTSIMTLYIIPRFTEIDTKKEFRKEVFDFYKSVMPIFGLGLLVIYILKPFMVSIVFSDEFQPVEDLFLWQLLGDFVKVLAIVIAYQFLAKKMFWHYILTEAFLVIILYILQVYILLIYLRWYVEGAVVAHFVSYLVCITPLYCLYLGALFWS